MLLLTDLREEKFLSSPLTIDTHVQLPQRVRGKRKAPEPSDDEGEEDDLNSEDAPLPGEEDAEDSDASDEDVIEQSDDEASAEEESEPEEAVEVPAAKKAANLPLHRARDAELQHKRGAGALDDDEDDSDEDLHEGIPGNDAHKKA